MERKVFYVDFNEDETRLGFNGVAFTKTPATKQFFVAMAEELKIFLSDDQQMAYGPLLIPEQRIPRYTKELGYFDIVFSKEVIAKLARNLQLKAIPFNYEHNPKKKVDGVLQEVWLTGEPDKSNAMGFKLPEGSLFGGVYLQDREFYLSEVKTGNVKGFSIEANMELLMTELKQIEMTKIKILLTEVTDIDGRVLKTAAESIEVGTVMYTEIDGAQKPLEKGEYKLSSGETLVVDEASTVVEIKPASHEDVAAAELNAQMSAVLEPFLKPLRDEIAALKVELAAIPAGDDKKKKEEKKKDELPVKMSAQEILADWSKRKAALGAKA